MFKKTKSPPLMPVQTHPADGLYSLTLNNVREATESSFRLHGWRAELPEGGDDDTPITITLQTVRRVQLVARTLGSLSALMLRKGKITEEQHKTFSDRYLSTPVLDEEARIFMDLLKARNERETFA